MRAPLQFDVFGDSRTSGSLRRHVVALAEAALGASHIRIASRGITAGMAVVAGCLIVQPGYSWQPDAAERLAYCVEQAVRTQTAGTVATQARCDLEMPGSFVVVLHPVGALREEEVVSAGLPQALLPELRELRLGTNAALYVIATGPDVSGTGSDRSTPAAGRRIKRISFRSTD